MPDSYKIILTSAITLLIGIVLSNIIPRLVGIVLKRLTSKTKTETDDFIVEGFIKAIKPLGLVLSFTLAWKILPVSEEFDWPILSIAKFIILIILVRFINKSLLRVIHRWSFRIDDHAISTMLKSITPMIRAIIWCVGIVFYLQNIGVQMAAIWALLSAGGIGAGLALKEPVQEFFEYITILLDKPFENGQFINIEGVWATVERVGVRSTRLRSLNGEIIVMSNSALTNGVISNYAEMEYRRMVHKLGVVYETSYSQIKRIPDLIKSIIDTTDDAKFDRCHFTGFGDSSLEIELVYFIPTNNYLRAMEAQQNINLEIMKCFEKEKIEFAFPTQTVHLVNKGENN